AAVTSLITGNVASGSSRLPAATASHPSLARGRRTTWTSATATAIPATRATRTSTALRPGDADTRSATQSSQANSIRPPSSRVRTSRPHAAATPTGRPTSRAAMTARSGALRHVGELGVVVEEGEPDDAGRAVSVLRHDDLSRAPVGRLGVVDLVAIDEHHDV